VTAPGPAPSAAPSAAPSRAEAFDKAAYTFCKAALLIVIARRFALPVASGLAAVFYLLTAYYRKQETNCVLKKPILIAAIWAVTCAVSLYFQLRPHPHP
jgi:hypothetical protein